MAGRNYDTSRPMRSSNDTSEIRLILVGLQGSGKSATGNSILGRRVFEDHLGGTSTETSCRHVRVVTNDQPILVVDTPSLIKKNTSEEQFSREIAKCLLLSSPGPHAVILVINVGRVPKDLQMAPRLLEEVFGVDVKEYIIIALTGGDQLRQHNMSKEDYIKRCPTHMSGILKKYPVVVMNNWEENSGEMQNQVEELMKVVNSRNKFLNNELYKQIERRLLTAEQVP